MADYSGISLKQDPQFSNRNSFLAIIYVFASPINGLWTNGSKMIQPSFEFVVIVSIATFFHQLGNVALRSTLRQLKHDLASGISMIRHRHEDGHMALNLSKL